MEQCDVIIVGAGPAGIFAAYELIKSKPSLRICLVEIGNLIGNRARSEVMSGVGGAGTFSDGKLHYTPVLSHEKMLHLYSEPEYQELLDYVDKIFTDFGVNAGYYPTDIGLAQALADEAKKKSIKLFIRKARHVGSDKLPEVIQKFEAFLLAQAVVIMDKTEALDIVVENQTVRGVKLSDGRQLLADNVILAPGRVRARWLQKLAEKYEL